MQTKLGWSIMAAAMLTGTSAAAQERASAERPFAGKLDSRSPKSDGHPYQVRTLPLEAGKRYALSAESDDFDPALRLSLADDNDETIAEDDDGGEGTNAYLEFVPPRSATYRIRVSAVNDGKGAYMLKIRDLPPLPTLMRPTAKSTSTLTFKHYAGELTATDAEIRGRQVDDYVFQFNAGKQVQILMERVSNKLDPKLEVYAGSDRLGLKALAQDDDSGNDMDAFLVFTPEESGEFIVRATSAGETSKFGAYNLRVGQMP